MWTNQTSHLENKTKTIVDEGVNLAPVAGAIYTRVSLSRSEFISSFSELMGGETLAMSAGRP